MRRQHSPAPCHNRAMTGKLDPRAARWLLAFLLLLMLYGSLQPFQLRPVDFSSPLDLVRRLRWDASTPGELFVNVLVYVPFGAVLAFALPPALGAAARIALATLAGFVLSSCVEVAQLFVVTRVASLADVATNTCGACLGCGAGLLARGLAQRLAASGSLRVTHEPAAAALALVWLATFLPPWRMRFNPVGWPAEWARLLESGWPAASAIALNALGWLTAALLLRAITRPQQVWPALLVLAAATLTVQFTWFARFAGAEQLLGALLALAAWPLLQRFPDRPLTAALAGAIALTLTWRALSPFEFGAHPRALRLVPFQELIGRGSTGFVLPLLFAKLFRDGSLVWLLTRLGVGALAAGVITALLLLAIGVGQLWVRPVHHLFTSTDPLLALAAGLVMALLRNPAAGTPRQHVGR